jgi:hypothetical protein
MLPLQCSMQTADSSRTKPLDDASRASVTALVRTYGDAKTAEMLRIGRPTVARAAAGFAIRPSVAQAITSRLAELVPTTPPAA